MIIHEARAIAAEGEALDLDPFAFWPDAASRLVGMGGAEAAENPDYAFHTLYVSCGGGSIVFSVRFDGLKAQRGTLILRIHELPEVMGAQARQVAISQSQLVDLIRGDGSVSLPAIARAGSHYALLGFIYGDTIAQARDISIEVARRTADPHDPALPTRYAASASRVNGVQQVVGEREGTLVTPMSQLCTLAQTQEPIFDALASQVGVPADLPLIGRWEAAYLARVLDRYDVARSGARGLGIGGIHDPLAPWLLQHGCSLVVTSPDDPPAGFAPPPDVEVLQLDPRRIEDLAGFDFAWATRRGGVGGKDRQELLTFIEDTLRALKRGGLFTLVVPIDVAPREIGDNDGSLIRRPDIDRIAMVLLSRGHQIAQLLPWGEAIAMANDDEMLMVSAFGLVIRKAA